MYDVQVLLSFLSPLNCTINFCKEFSPAKKICKEFHHNSIIVHSMLKAAIFIILKPKVAQFLKISLLALSTAFCKMSFGSFTKIRKTYYPKIVLCFRSGVSPMGFKMSFFFSSRSWSYFEATTDWFLTTVVDPLFEAMLQKNASSLRYFISFSVVVSTYSGGNYDLGT